MQQGAVGRHAANRNTPGPFDLRVVLPGVDQKSRKEVGTPIGVAHGHVPGNVPNVTVASLERDDAMLEEPPGPAAGPLGRAPAFQYDVLELVGRRPLLSPAAVYQARLGEVVVVQQLLARPPSSSYANALLQIAEHDARRPEVRAKLLAEARSGTTPFWWLGFENRSFSPCTHTHTRAYARSLDFRFGAKLDL